MSNNTDNNQTTQKQAVIDAVSSVLGNRFVNGQTNVKSIITGDETTKVRELVSNGIVSGRVAYGKNSTDVAAVNRYTAGLIENHFRKAKELNGGSKYVPTNSRPRKNRDEQLSTLTKLLDTYEEGSEEYNSVLEAIAVRENELASAKSSGRKSKAVSAAVDMSVLPDDLKSMLSI